MSTGLYHHAARGVLCLSGDERVDFLQGLVTQDVQRVAIGSALYSAFLTPQGRFLYDFFIFSDGASLYLTPERDHLAAFQKKLSLYKLRRAVSITDVSADWHLVSAWGIEPPADALAAPDPRHAALGTLWLASAPPKPSLTQADYDARRMPLAIPDGSRDMPYEKAIPLEHNLDRANAIAWDKGCYMGQELTARTRYRGLVRKRLFAVQRQTGAMPASGTAIFYNNEEVGELRSHTDDLALAYLRIEAVEQALAAGAPLHAGQATLAVLPDTAG